MLNRQLTDSDVIVTMSLDAYLETLGANNTNMYPQEKLFIREQAKIQLYSDIARRVPRIAAYILSSDISKDTYAQGAFKSLENHVLDPVFIDILMQYLKQNNNPEENVIVGALLAKIMNRWFEKNWKEPTKTTSKKGDKEKEKTEEIKNDATPILHVQKAVEALLENLIYLVHVRAANLTETEAIAVAACIAMNSQETITSIIETDLPVTADIFDIVKDPSAIITGALLLKEADYTQLTKNQQAFMDSLVRWVYGKLNQISTQACFQFLVSAYNEGISPNVKPYYIKIKDASKATYSNLDAVSQQLIK